MQLAYQKSYALFLFLCKLGYLQLWENLEPAVTYRAFYYDPINGKEYPLGIVRPNGEKGEWILALFPILQDRILVLQKG